jgi:hypothetical protein
VPPGAAGANFTVSAWVFLTSNGNYAAAVSQNASSDSSFELQDRTDHNAWSLSRSAADTTAPAMILALSAAPPALSTWTQLTGTYTAATGLMTLYVNGQLLAR